jgi:hypothetical protein
LPLWISQQFEVRTWQSKPTTKSREVVAIRAAGQKVRVRKSKAGKAAAIRRAEREHGEKKQR